MRWVGGFHGEDSGKSVGWPEEWVRLVMCVLLWGSWCFVESMGRRMGFARWGDDAEIVVGGGRFVKVEDMFSRCDMHAV